MGTAQQFDRPVVTFGSITCCSGPVMQRPESQQPGPPSEFKHRLRATFDFSSHREIVSLRVERKEIHIGNYKFIVTARARIASGLIRRDERSSQMSDIRSISWGVFGETIVLQK
jgi:hypothetical protein